MGDAVGETLIRIDNLSKIYGQGESAVRALDQVSLAVERGELLAIMGPSGCGKSTLLNMIGALDSPSEGQVWVAGANLAQIKDMDHFRARTVGFIFQLHNLLPTLNAVENVEVPMQGQGVSKRGQRQQALHLLERVGLSDRAAAMPSQLSGGQRQRVAIARALANNPPLLLADEPTGALDSQSGEALLTLLGELNRDSGTTIIIVTHDRHVAQATRRIVRMRDGRIVEDHRLVDPIEEDLRTLAASRLGQAILEEEDAPLPQITAEEEAVLRRILLRVKGVQQEQKETLSYPASLHT
jgi:ABC-type lipoprotein export system ATPase subunit